MTNYALIVAGDSETESRLSGAMGGLGFAALRAPDLPQARRLIAWRLPAVVVVAQATGESGGLEFCEWLRAAESTSSVPAVVLAEDADLDERLSILEAGADECLPASCADQELSARVSTILRGYAARPVSRV
jgi:DNA-binding response OmpR family regulator